MSIARPKLNLNFWACIAAVQSPRFVLVSISHLVLTFGISGCFTSSMYKFQSQPNEASVYYMNGTEKTLIGQTPIDYTKAALPSDTPFVIIFEKPGFETKEISVSPTDNSQTTVSANLKSSNEGPSDAATKRIRDILKKVFAVQELTAKQKYVDALAALSKLEDSEPSLAEINVIKGSIYLMLNDKVEARKQWEKALKLDSSLDEIRTRIKNLPSSSNKSEVSK
ncbi:MAG: hypothetical protein NT027_09725 [Proteobacteria bacterium]|nr:hypothetical protein [Pseudomonadota bacterium]